MSISLANTLMKSHRDIHLECCFNLIGAVVKNAVEECVKAKRETRIDQLDWKRAMDFIFTSQLNKFTLYWCLPLKPSYVRSMTKKRMKDIEIEDLDIYQSFIKKYKEV